ncbi:hypothetical protein Rcas_1191 [Roseiflexus castenholzii DSM 13941]|uniref:Uncharacterized protein n=1 Tax=Roseiflexus castenholzii (strain DSM 13941 / HLO8) TaxID=383372 RepID=A7NII8_ROSCS|nr:hypothetical protein Rcas_1191 [Roseiflexus castenholzii DSM 13941]
MFARSRQFTLQRQRPECDTGNQGKPENHPHTYAPGSRERQDRSYFILTDSIL